MAEAAPVARIERGRPRDLGNDAAILQAALDLLIERGATGTSMEGVAKRAGVAKLTVYRRWASKEDLLMAAMEFARTDDLEPPVPVQSVDDVIDFVAALLSRPRFRTLMARVIGASVDYPQLMTAYTDRYLKPRMEALVGIAQREIDAGRLPPGTDPLVIQDVLSSAIGFVLLRHADVTASEIALRMRTLLHQLGYRNG